MEKYKLIIFPAAQRDMQDMVDYLNELSPQAALSSYDEIIERISTLVQLPLRCPLMKSPVLRAKGYRVLVVNNYLVFYVVNDKTVEIRRILYGKRQHEPLL